MVTVKFHGKTERHLPQLLPRLFVSFCRRNFTAKLMANRPIPCSVIFGILLNLVKSKIKNLVETKI
jgi:hypothetical protein